MEIIDTHTHLYTEEFDGDVQEVMARARQAGVSRVYMPNIDVPSVKRLLRVCEANKGFCFPMMGLHPTSVSSDYKRQLQQIFNYFEQHPDLFVAVGEVGMDLYWDSTYLNEQIVAFSAQVEWAQQLDLPLVIHCRNAFQYVRDALLPYKGASLRGVFHSFTGDLEEAESMLEFEHFLFGINGIVTYKKSSMAEALARIPIERIVLETDAPYLAPAPHRGERNESVFITYILRRVAELYQMPQDEVARITSQNALRLFGKR